MLIGAPIARLATVITIGQPEPRRVGQRLGHEEQPLARGGGVGPSTGRRGADARRDRAELGLDHQVLARRQVAGPRPDRRAPRRCGSAGRSGTPPRPCGRHRATVVGDRARTLELPKHGLAPPPGASDDGRVLGAAGDVRVDDPSGPRRRTVARIAPATASSASTPVMRRDAHRAVRCWAADVRAARGPGRSPGTVTHAEPAPDSSPRRAEIGQRRDGVDHDRASSVRQPGENGASRSRVGSCTTTTSGWLDRVVRPDRIGRRCGRRPRPAPRCARTRSSGSAWACRPWSKAATDSSSAAVTTPWPPRPWMRTSSFTVRRSHGAADQTGRARPAGRCSPTRCRTSRRP